MRCKNLEEYRKLASIQEEVKESVMEVLKESVKATEEDKKSEKILKKLIGPKKLTDVSFFLINLK